ncbi:receptor homology region transmembrane domain-and ring domain-containing protein 2 [Phtheirospermum japonicum]|uniref:Receptor homology region transmembrane domain-and ring domain-containing protein 2 n=1 Tax=Phtheirospermum japonicum TaxID=374723 RepID=A0A830B2E9_9LAMI|nr:receptor homology region transmembrane domain-and ring domain-containing protein 2 [Phtheirospermum japonicum]
MLNFWVFFCCILIGAFTASGRVVLMSSQVNLSFEDIEANFAPSVKGSGKCGMLNLAEPLDACSPLTNKIVLDMNDTRYPFVLIVRGGCSFVDKVRRAQDAGFKAAIVYNNDNSDLVAMAGHSSAITINAVFVTKVAGEILAKYAGADDIELWLSPSYENSVWSIMAMSFISLLAMSAVLATCFFVRRHRIRRERPRAPSVREFHGISSRLLKAMPSLIFTAVLEDNCTSQTCAICLEDYSVGEKLRILPCRHKFHAFCVDTWLTSWRTFCPVCKRDARTSTGEPPASESTPLLSSVSSNSLLSSFRSSFASTSALQIGPSYNNRSPSASRPQSISSTPYNHPHTLHSQHQLSSVDFSQRSDSAYLVSPHSLGHTALSPLSVGSTSRQANPLHYSRLEAFRRLLLLTLFRDVEKGVSDCGKF